MRFLFASDSFKGTLSSSRSAELLQESAVRFFPEAHTHALQIADGGEGTASAVVAATGGTWRRVLVRGSRNAAVHASYGLLPGGRAVVELAEAAGLPQLSVAQRNPLATSTYGVGQLVLDALEQGARDISLAIGGSSTNDGGMGFLRALGVRFLDQTGEELLGCGADLARVAAIDLDRLDPRVAQTSFYVMCDVDNPLLGPRGATRVFGPQKGATPEVVEELERGMRNYAQVVGQTFPSFDPMEPGMGAAGGMGAATKAFLHATIVPGIEQVLDLVGFDRLLEGCDLCVTGEGHADAQSAHGKVVSGVAARCRRTGVPCAAIVGGMDYDATELLECGVDVLVPTVVDAVGVEQALAHAEQNYRLAADRMFGLLRLGMGLRA